MLFRIFIVLVIGYINLFGYVSKNFDNPAKDIYYWQKKLYLVTQKHLFILNNSVIVNSFGNFREAESVAVNDNGIYIVDSYTKMVYRYDFSGNLLNSWGGKGIENNKFRKPIAVELDNRGRVYIADKYAREVKVFSKSGNFIKKFKVGFKMIDMTLDNNFLYLSDYSGNIKLYDKDEGTYRKEINNFNGKIDFAYSISTDNKGGLFIGSMTNCVFYLDSSFKVVEYWGKACGKEIPFETIEGIAYNGKNKIYIANWHNPNYIEINLPKNNKSSFAKATKVTTKYSGIFKWDKPISNIKFYNTLFWQDSSVNGDKCFDYNRAERYCSNLKESFFGLNISYRLPKIEELKELKNHKKLFDFVKPDSYYWSQSEGGFGHYAYMVPRGFLKPKVSSFVSASCSNVRCVSMNSYTEFQNKTFDETVSIFKDFLLKQLNNRVVNIPKPDYIKPKKLFKDEFETTEMFQKRLEKERDRVKKYNEKLKKEYEKKLKTIQHNNKKIDKNLLNQYALSAAFYIKFGSPKFEDIKYNADKESFEIVIKSQKDNFIYRKNVQVPIKYAKNYKNILMHLTPNVELKANKGYVEVYNVKEFNNPIALVEKNIYLSLKTIKEFENFIKEYPNSKYIKSAKIRLAQLKDDQKSQYDTLIKSEDIYSMREFIKRYPDSNLSINLQNRISQIVQKREEEKRKELIAQQEAEQRAYESPKEIGDAVCKDIRSFFITLNIKGYVEDVNENNGKILIRVVNSYGAKPYYKGVKLERDVSFWDYYKRWKLCN